MYEYIVIRMLQSKNVLIIYYNTYINFNASVKNKCKTKLLSKESL